MTFEQKIKKLNRIKDAGWKYLMRRVNPRLSDAFWEMYGYRYKEVLTDIRANHPNEWGEYCKANNIWSGHSASDAFC